MNIRITSAERAELQRLADASKRKLSDYVRLILQEHLEEEKSAAAKAEKKKR